MHVLEGSFNSSPSFWLVRWLLSSPLVSNVAHSPQWDAGAHYRHPGTGSVTSHAAPPRGLPGEARGVRFIASSALRGVNRAVAEDLSTGHVGYRSLFPWRVWPRGTLLPRARYSRASTGYQRRNDAQFVRALKSQELGQASEGERRVGGTTHVSPQAASPPARQGPSAK